MPRAKKVSTQSYFERLSFDPELLKSWVAGYFGQIRIVLLLIIAITALGIFSYFNLPKRLNPEVKIPIVTVVTILPGASPDDVESLVTIPLENSIRGLQGLDTLTSVSRENISVISTQFVSSVDRDTAKDQVQSEVDGVNDLPDNAQTPTVKALDFEDSPIWTFAIDSDGDIPSLMSFSQDLKRKIQDLSKVDRVEVSGFEEQEISITVKPEKISQYGLNPLQLSQLIRASLSSFPAGTVATDAFTFSVTIDPSVSSIQDIRDIRISSKGEVVSLGDIAEVTLRSKSGQAPAFLATAETDSGRAVTFSVFKVSSVNIDEAGKQVKKLVDEEITQRDGKFKLTTFVNTPQEIADQFSELVGEFRATIILVFVCLFLFLGLRQAIIASFTVPLTFLCTFFIMSVIGMSINFLSLFAFLLALGLLVDDTIVVVSAMTSYYKTGKYTPLQTGLLVWKDTIVPIWATTLTTIWSFVPLLITSGIIGEFIKPIPIVVTAVMVSSTAIATLITLPIMILILKPQVPGRVKVLLQIVGVLGSLTLLLLFMRSNILLPLIAVAWVAVLVMAALTGKKITTQIQKAVQKQPMITRGLVLLKKYSDSGVVNIEGVASAYHSLILRILSSKSNRRKVMAAIVIYALFSFSLLPLGLVQNEFFPKTDTSNIYVAVELPNGVTQDKSEAIAAELLIELKNTPEVEYVTAEVGKGFDAGGFGGASSQTNSVLFSLHLGEKETRKESSIVISEKLREKYKDYTAGKISVVEESSGPPAGSDVQITLLGNELQQLDEYAQKIQTHLEEQPGITNVASSIKPGTSRYVFVPNQAELAQNGIGSDSLGIWLRIFSTGLDLNKIQLDANSQDQTDIVFKTQYGLADPSSLSSLSVPTNQGSNLPLLSLGQVELKSNPTQITREDSKRTVTITASVTQGVSISETSAELEKFADTLNLPSGYSWKTGGVNDENQKSINSILQAMLVSALLILITMVVEFGSFRKAFIVMIVIPLAVSSVFLLFAITGTPLSFPALIGVLSLFGIVVTNSMFIVDKININQRQGMKLKEAIADAGASRLEPIILTKLATVLGLLPITLSNPLWRGLGGAIISGLLISSTIMLLFIPTLYYTMFQHEDEPDL